MSPYDRDDELELLSGGVSSDTKPGEEVQQKKQDLDKKERFYVDAYKLSRVLYHLLLSLNLTDSYSLFVLNPKSPLSENQVYGYRYMVTFRLLLQPLSSLQLTSKIQSGIF